ncbi:MAG TPA: hypothetical protein VF247_12860 [Candidatus Krumholzibacteria bacterium]
MTEVRHSVVTATWASIDADLLRRVRRTSILLGMVMAVPLAFYIGWLQATAWIAGFAWSLANLAVIRSIVARMLADGPRDKKALALAMAIKFPVLYGALAVMLAVLRLPVIWWMAGFSWPFFVAVMKSLGRLYLRLDENS